LSITSNPVTAVVVPDPSISVHPTGGTVCAGGTFNLSVSAQNGTPSLKYQWESSATPNVGFTAISGATSANYTTVSLTANTYYRVVVSADGNGCNSITSNETAVLVSPGPTIIIQPQDGTICVNNNYTFTVAATGSIAPGTVSYQWQVATVLAGPYSNVTNGSGGTTSTYTTPVFSTVSQSIL